jgi:hypothetical protein
MFKLCYLNGGTHWSWDESRLLCIEFKRTLSDCAVDGVSHFRVLREVIGSLAGAGAPLAFEAGIFTTCRSATMI